MAAEQDLTTRQIARLAHVISIDRMETIALGYLDLEEGEVTTLRVNKKDQPEAFNREVLRIWKNKNSTLKQIKKLASKLYEAADEGGYVDPKMIKKILGISKQEANALDSETEEDDFGLNTLIQHLKARAAELTTEIAPWAKDFVVKMEDIKTRLDVIKDKGKQIKWATSDYMDIFEGTEPLAKCRHSKFQILRKVLVKGRIGQGKSTVAKKMVFDWGQGLFKTFPIVLFIDMRLARSDDTIENIIIDQYSLGDLNFTSQKIKEILDKFGSDCLVIIDGLCDHSIQCNENVLCSIQNADLSFNLLLTLPESNFIENVDNYFDTICKVQGFKFNDIQSNLPNLVNDCRISTLKSMQSLCPEACDDSNHINPLLVVLLSFLRSQKPCLSDQEKHLSIRNIYMKTLLCLVGSVDLDSQRNSVKFLGKIALDIFQSGKVYNKTEITECIGLNSGLLIQSNSLVCFAHSSLQIFLVSWYLMLILDEGATIESLLGTNCEKPVFMINSLFLYFCLSLLDEPDIIKFKNVKQVRMQLKKYVLGRIDSVQLDLRSIARIYPALNIARANRQKDELYLQFLFDILSEINILKDLILTPCPGLPVHKILSAMKDQCKTLQSIRLLDDDEEIHVKITDEFCPDDLSVIIHNQSGECVDDLLQFLQAIERSSCIYFIGGNRSKPMIDFAMFPANVRKLHISSREGTRHPESYLVTNLGISQYPNLTHLCLPKSKLEMWGEAVTIICEAFRNGKFPVLSHCNVKVNGLMLNFSQLFHSGLPSLRSLNAQDMWFEKQDSSRSKEILIQLDTIAVGGEPLPFQHCPDPLPSLSCLHVGPAHFNISILPHLVQAKCPNLSELELYKTIINIHDLYCYRWKLPNLVRLSAKDVEYWARPPQNLSQFEMFQTLRVLEISGIKKPLETSGQRRFCLISSKKSFQQLESLTMRNCNLCAQDYRCLAQASVDGYLPRLCHLDISMNNDMTELSKLFEFDCKWENLQTLSVDREEEAHSDQQFHDFPFLITQVQSGCLPSLETAAFFVETPRCLPTERFIWPILISVQISTTSVSMYKEILSYLVHATDRGYFPALRIVSLSADKAQDLTNRPCLASEKQRLRQKGVCVYFVSRKDNW